MFSAGIELMPERKLNPERQPSFKEAAAELTNQLMEEKKGEEKERTQRIELFQIELVKAAIQQLRENGLRSVAEIECRIEPNSDEIRISDPAMSEMVVLREKDSDLDENFVSKMNAKLKSDKPHLEFKLAKKEYTVYKLQVQMKCII